MHLASSSQIVNVITQSREVYDWSDEQFDVAASGGALGWSSSIKHLVELLSVPHAARSAAAALKNLTHEPAAEGEVAKAMCAQRAALAIEAGCLAPLVKLARKDTRAALAPHPLHNTSKPLKLSILRHEHELVCTIPCTAGLTPTRLLCDARTAPSLIPVPPL